MATQSCRRTGTAKSYVLGHTSLMIAQVLGQDRLSMYRVCLMQCKGISLSLWVKSMKQICIGNGQDISE